MLGLLIVGAVVKTVILVLVLLDAGGVIHLFKGEHIVVDVMAATLTVMPAPLVMSSMVVIPCI